MNVKYSQIRDQPGARRQWQNLLVILLRISLGIFGAFLLAWGCSVAIAVALNRAGLEASEAVLSGALLAFLIYPAAALWAFLAQRLWWVAVVLIGGGLLLTWISPLLVMPAGGSI